MRVLATRGWLPCHRLPQVRQARVLHGHRQRLPDRRGAARQGQGLQVWQASPVHMLHSGCARGSLGWRTMLLRSGAAANCPSPICLPQGVLPVRHAHHQHRSRAQLPAEHMGPGLLQHRQLRQLSVHQRSNVLRVSLVVGPAASLAWLVSCWLRLGTTPDMHCSSCVTVCLLPVPRRDVLPLVCPNGKALSNVIHGTCVGSTGAPAKHCHSWASAWQLAAALALCAAAAVGCRRGAVSTNTASLVTPAPPVQASGAASSSRTLPSAAPCVRPGRAREAAAPAQCAAFACPGALATGPCFSVLPVSNSLQPCRVSMAAAPCPREVFCASIHPFIIPLDLTHPHTRSPYLPTPTLHPSVDAMAVQLTERVLERVLAQARYIYSRLAHAAAETAAQPLLQRFFPLKSLCHRTQPSLAPLHVILLVVCRATISYVSHPSLSSSARALRT